MAVSNSSTPVSGIPREIFVDIGSKSIAGGGVGIVFEVVRGGGGCDGPKTSVSKTSSSNVGLGATFLV